MPPAPAKVLLVDDDPAILRILAHWLESAGYEVRTGCDGREALALIEADCPDFVLTDWEMPCIDGPALCRRIRAMDLPHYVYVLFLTAKSSPGELVLGLEAGADDFLCKPVLREEMLARMCAGMRVVRLERRLSQMANTDPLTGLLTQRAFFERLEQEWHRVRRHALPLSCVMVDVDYFKRINDTFGHPFGDGVLRAIGECLRESVRESDLVCRYGGEEFCILLPETDSRGATQWAERVRKRLAMLAFPAGERVVRVTGSFGTTEIHADTQRAGQLVDQADQALLCAKQSGRDRVICYESIQTADGMPVPSDGQSGCLFAGVTARDVMTPLVASLRKSMTVGEAAEYFLRSRINSAPVVDEEGKLTGMLSEKDLMAAMVSLECWSHPLSDVIRSNVIVYEEREPIRTIYEFLCRVSIRRVVVVSRGAPTGTISRGTLLRWFRNQVLGSGLMGQIPRSAAENRSSQWCCRDLERTARTIAATAGRLQEELADASGGRVPLVVGAATRIQELVNDLLANARDAEPAGRGLHSGTLMLGSGHTD